MINVVDYFPDDLLLVGAFFFHAKLLNTAWPSQSNEDS